MFPQMLMTAFTPLRDRNEFEGWENKPFITSWPEPQENHVSSSWDHPGFYGHGSFVDHEIPTETNYAFSSYPRHGMKILRFADGKSEANAVTKTIKKKKKRNRTAFSTEQLSYLEQHFKHNEYIDVLTRQNIARTTNLTERTIKIWFQNRRMKKKKEALDVYDSDSSGKSSPLNNPNKVDTDSPIEHVSQIVAQSTPQHGNHVGNSESFGNYDCSNAYSNVNYQVSMDVYRKSLQNNAFDEIHYEYKPEFTKDFEPMQPNDSYAKCDDTYNYFNYGDFLCDIVQ